MYRSTLCSYFHIILLNVMKQIITMLYFQIAVDIIGLPIYLHHYCEEKSTNTSRFFKSKNTYNFNQEIIK